MRTETPVKSKIFAPFALTLAAAGLAACGSQQQSSTAPASGPAEGVSVSDGRLVLPAVKGNPGAVYFTVHNDSGNPATLQAVEVEGAGDAMMHETITISGHSEMREVDKVEVPAGGEVAFAPGGKHVMAMDLKDELKPGGTTDVTLSFASGEKSTFPAEIFAAGNAR
jgi:copper(I)-binding protein